MPESPPAPENTGGCEFKETHRREKQVEYCDQCEEESAACVS